VGGRAGRKFVTFFELFRIIFTRRKFVGHRGAGGIGKAATQCWKSTEILVYFFFIQNNTFLWKKYLFL